MGDVVNLEERKAQKLLEVYEYFYLLGRRDFENGISFRNNPYLKESIEYDMWRKGWWTALGEYSNADSEISKDV